MARKKIREHDAKRALREHAKRLAGLDLDLRVLQVDAETDWDEARAQEQWLSTSRLVVKPDMLFGKRGKHDLVGLDLDLDQAATFVSERLGKQVTVDGCTGTINTFLVERFVPHDEEYYLCIQSERLGNAISFSTCGGIDIEDNWAQVRRTFVPTAQPLTEAALAPLLGQLAVELRDKVYRFIHACYLCFEDLDFTLMEFNPFTLDPQGEPLPLDMRGVVDSTACFRSARKFPGGPTFPRPFGMAMAPQEQRVAALDEHSGASLKLSILNPKGHIWTMVAGGGASVIYADTVADLGCSKELGNYAEYSGAPNDKETYKFASAVISCCLAVRDRQPKAIIVGGGIANFTDIATTFAGIMRAVDEKCEQLKQANVRFYVRRGGPNYKQGLANIEKLLTSRGIVNEVYGPEASMTGICSSAIQFVTGASA